MAAENQEAVVYEIFRLLREQLGALIMSNYAKECSQELANGYEDEIKKLSIAIMERSQNVKSKEDGQDIIATTKLFSSIMDWLEERDNKVAINQNNDRPVNLN